MQTELRLVSLERLRLIAVEAERIRDVEEELGSRIERVGRPVLLGALGMITGLLEGFPLQEVAPRLLRRGLVGPRRSLEPPGSRRRRGQGRGAPVAIISRADAAPSLSLPGSNVSTLRRFRRYPRRVRRTPVSRKQTATGFDRARAPSRREPMTIAPCGRSGEPHTGRRRRRGPITQAPATSS